MSSTPNLTLTGGRFLGVTIDLVDETNLDLLSQEFADEMTAAFTLIGDQIALEAQNTAAVGATGNFALSIVSSGPIISDDNGAVSVDVYSNLADEIAAAVQEGVDPRTGLDTEQGRRSGAAFPNVTQLMGWIEAVLGLDEEEAEEAAYPIGRAIAARGLPRDPNDPHFRPILKAMIANEANIDDLIDAALEKVYS